MVITNRDRFIKKYKLDTKEGYGVAEVARITTDSDLAKEAGF